MLRLVLSVLCVSLCSAGKASKGSVAVSDVVNPDPDALNRQAQGEYNSDMFEGDIVPADGNEENRNAVQDKNKLWPEGKVPYVIDRTVSSGMKSKIMDAIADFNQYTCVRYVPRQQEKDYALINSRAMGCYAKMGRQGGEQPLNLNPMDCDVKGSVIHEMLHTIGFAHEQSRGDRDEYIKVHWNNINQEKHPQFRKMMQHEEDNMGFPYDYSSVMHYGPLGFSNNGFETITTLDAQHQRKIGQRAGFSKQDIAEVNKLYKCSGSGSTSSVGGTNGCSDKIDNCAEIAGNCRGHTIRTMCKATCKRC